MTPATHARLALRALAIATEILGELELGPLLRRPYQASLDCVINAGAAVEFLERCCRRVEKEAIRRFGKSPKAATRRTRFISRAMRLSVEKKPPPTPRRRRK